MKLSCEVSPRISVGQLGSQGSTDMGHRPSRSKSWRSAGRALKGLAGAGLCWILLAGAAGDVWSEETVPVVASIIPLGDFCERLGGDRVDVQVIIPPGACPHMFEPPPSVVVKVANARIFVLVGAGLEPWAERLLRVHTSGEQVVVEGVRGIPLVGDSGEPRQGEHEHNRERVGAAASGDHGGHRGNPHIWLDPIFARDICRRIAEAFMSLDAAHRGFYAERLREYLEELEALHLEIGHRVAQFRIREFVALHSSFTYFARRYGLREVGVIEASPGRETTPRHLVKIVRDIRRYGIRVVFAEPQLSSKAAEVIAREAGAEVLVLDPMGGRPPYGSDYIEMMRHNLSVLDEAMR